MIKKMKLTITKSILKYTLIYILLTSVFQLFFIGCNSIPIIKFCIFLCFINIVLTLLFIISFFVLVFKVLIDEN